MGISENGWKSNFASKKKAMENQKNKSLRRAS
jgi:hypothetical protein